MKARVKATGEIIEVKVYKREHRLYIRTHGEKTGEIYRAKDLDFNIEDGNTSDYWTRLEHQYAGMAMQGILANIDLLMSLAKKKSDDYPAKYTVAEFAKDCAHALVEKMKEERK